MSDNLDVKSSDWEPVRRVFEAGRPTGRKIILALASVHGPFLFLLYILYQNKMIGQAVRSTAVFVFVAFILPVILLASRDYMFQSEYTIIVICASSSLLSAYAIGGMYGIGNVIIQYFNACAVKTKNGSLVVIASLLCAYIPYQYLTYYCDVEAKSSLDFAYRQFERRNYNNALPALERAYSLASTKSRKPLMIEAKTLTGIAQLKTGAIDEAMATLDKLILRTEGNQGASNRQKMLMFQAMGDCYIAKKDYASAMYIYKRSVSIDAKRDEAYNILRAYSRLGTLCLKTGDPIHAIEYYKTALEKSKEQGDLSGQASILALLGNAYMEQGDIRSSRQAFGEAKVRFEQLGDVRRSEFIQSIIDGKETMTVNL